MSTENKTKPTSVSIDTFLDSVSDKRREEAKIIIDIMSKISGEKPAMWGPSIIGFGSQHYKYDSGREGDMPRLAFSPRKASLTFYLGGLEKFENELASLGKHKLGKGCLYINKLDDIKIEILSDMLEKSFAK